MIGMMTNIYHMVYHTHDNSIYISFEGCNFRCIGCLLKQSIWDCHLADNVQHKLQAVNNVERLSLGEFRTIVERFDVKRAVLGGAEPTLDKELIKVIDSLNTLDIKTDLLTNGYILNEKFVEELEKAGLTSVRVSIKTHNDDTHQFYTGQTNSPVLDNFKLLNESQIELKAESVLIPGLIEKDEIGRIARFITNVNLSIPYRIDGFIPIHDTPWRSPSPKEVIEAAQIARRYLKNVSYIHSKTKIKEEIINVYPIIKDESYPKTMEVEVA
ncbi:MAG: radical SAM protein [Nitrososphaerales archaeon]|nr:radical SAM protein [Nitrososphaerales archaeon]